MSQLKITTFKSTETLSNVQSDRHSLQHSVTKITFHLNNKILMREIGGHVTLKSWKGFSAGVNELRILQIIRHYGGREREELTFGYVWRLLTWQSFCFPYFDINVQEVSPLYQVLLTSHVT
ncbi:hypothetical protein WN51_05123 [Melipona quadrifasciata]|uniref:Uncharacterized protein n=1 Tax=Melipona quadrifasciata TaxID=166423 RepID=A0A0M8ZU56_9HYME|nr:hypothetical protein WN51_05123 [Melipona quadrifasciata]